MILILLYGNYKLPFKYGEVTNCRRAASIEVFAQRGELIYGALNKKELVQIKKDLKNLILIDIDNKTCDLFLELLSKYALSHKLAIPDGFIAATAIANDVELFTLNLKDYRFIDGLKLYKK